MIFNKSDIPFFNELELVDYQVKKDNITYDVYEASEWECAKKVDALMENEFEGYEIDEYKIEKNINF